jgi:hypothetical protein
MTDATATFYDVPAIFDGRVSPLGDLRRVFRVAVNGAAIGLGTVAALCVLVTTVTVTAAWIVNTALATDPKIYTKAASGPAAIALASHNPTLARAADYSSLGRSATVPADALTFEAKWAGAMASASPPASTPPLQPTLTAERADRVPLPRPRPARQEIARAPVAQAAPQVAAAMPPPAPTAENRVPAQQAHNNSVALPGPDSRTAVYDISARTVYLPNGEKLEAHSGLYDKMDDPRFVNVRMRGPTPPNVYDLTLREELFHGVRAIRLNPVDEDKMFGRDGMLAHTYMLGANGQSNGCVSFKDYPKFLQAFLRGEVDRLVVVSHLGNTPLPVARARRGRADRYALNSRYESTP